MSSDTVTWIGTAFSIIGAAIAIWQSWVASRAASRAEQVRDEITAKHVHNELSVLDGLLAAALNAMDKYGPGRSLGSLVGSSPDGDADVVRAFTAALGRHREMLEKTFGEPCDVVRNRINVLLGEFAAAVVSNERMPKGCDIYLEITTFSGNMKKALDAKTFDVAAPALLPAA